MAPTLEVLAKQVKWLGTLGRVIPWGLAQKPPWTVADVIIQDEYTHDIILSCDDGRAATLLLDCT
jgi:hypothetical protein